MHLVVLGVAGLEEYMGNYHRTEYCEEVLTRTGMDHGDDASKRLTEIRRKRVGCRLDMTAPQLRAYT